MMHLARLVQHSWIKLQCVEVGNGLSGNSGVYLVAFVELSRSPLPLLLKLVTICASEIQSRISVGVP